MDGSAGVVQAVAMAPGATMGAAPPMRDALNMARVPPARPLPRAAAHDKLRPFPNKGNPSATEIDSTRVSAHAMMGALKWAQRSSFQGKAFAPTTEAASRYERNAFEMTRTDGGAR